MPRFRQLPFGDLSGTTIGAALKVHSVLGPGLLESAYHACLAYELRKAGLEIEAQVPLPIRYDGVELDIGYRMDIVVERTLVVEIKAVTRLHPLHQAQLLSYLRLSGYPLGLLMNFHVPHLRDGIKRLVNGA